MNLFRFFKRKPPEVPTPEAVRNALKIAIEGMEPEVTLGEFESLYEKVLDSELHNRRDCADIINNFSKQRR